VPEYNEDRIMLSKGDYWIVVDGRMMIAREILRAETHVAVNVYRNMYDYKNKKIMEAGLIVQLD